MLQAQTLLYAQFPASQAKSQGQLRISACREALTYAVRKLEAKPVFNQFLPSDSADAKAGAVEELW